MLNKFKETHTHILNLLKKKLTQRSNKKAYEPNLNECRLALKRGRKIPFQELI